MLRLAAAGLNNRSIAGEMSIGLETVKTYLVRIYGKLEVDGRREAVQRARRTRDSSVRSAIERDTPGGR